MKMNESEENVALIGIKDRVGNPHTVRRMTTLRLLPETYEKLDMLSRETGRSRREIIEILISQAKVGSYDKGD